MEKETKKVQTDEKKESQLFKFINEVRNNYLTAGKAK